MRVSENSLGVRVQRIKTFSHRFLRLGSKYSLSDMNRNEHCYAYAPNLAIHLSTILHLRMCLNTTLRNTYKLVNTCIEKNDAS